MTKKLNKDEFVQRSITKFGSVYSYDKVEYKTALLKVTITCPVHGDFYKTPSKHLMGQGCPSCTLEKMSELWSKGKSKFVEEAKTIHGNRYTYDKVEYKNYTAKVIITCLEHGDFEQSPSHHLRGQKGCKLCLKEELGERVADSFSNVVEKARSIHGDRYDYPDQAYTGCKDKTTLICKIHGTFETTMDNHINAGSGCSKCFSTESQAQTDLSNYIEELGYQIIKNYRLKNRAEIDVFLPALNIGFEYNGLYWHSEGLKGTTYHRDKTNQADSEGIRLIHIWEDEWILHPNKVKNLIQTLLNKQEQSYYARNTNFRKIAWKNCSSFLETFHLQGSCSPTKFCYGLISGADIVSVMCFHETGVDGEIELTRFASQGIVKGGFTKLLTNALKGDLTDYSKVVSFSDTRWSRGDVYKTSGFILEHETPPSYFWCKGIVRQHRRGFQHKYLKNKLKHYDPNLSETENCIRNGYIKVWDCGKKKWILNNPYKK